MVSLKSMHLPLSRPRETEQHELTQILQHPESEIHMSVNPLILDDNSMEILSSDMQWSNEIMQSGKLMAKRGREGDSVTIMEEYKKQLQNQYGFGKPIRKIFQNLLPITTHIT